VTGLLTKPVRRLLAVTILFILLLGLWSFPLDPGVQFINDRRDEIATLTFERQHLWDMKNRQAGLERATANLRSELVSSAILWTGPSSTVIAAHMQDILRQAGSTGGGQTKSTSVIGEGVEDGLHKISIRIQLEGPLETLQEVLLTVQRQKPPLFVDDLTVSAPTWHSTTGKPMLSIDVGVTGYIEAPVP
jgi:hypothetical protein